MIQTKMMKKQKYEAPSLTVVEFKTEEGYATSWSSNNVINSLDITMMNEIAMDPDNSSPVAGYMSSGGPAESVSGWKNSMSDAGWF